MPTPSSKNSGRPGELWTLRCSATTIEHPGLASRPPRQNLPRPQAGAASNSLLPVEASANAGASSFYLCQKPHRLATRGTRFAQPGSARAFNWCTTTGDVDGLYCISCKCTEASTVRTGIATSWIDESRATPELRAFPSIKKHAGTRVLLCLIYLFAFAHQLARCIRHYLASKFGRNVASLLMLKAAARQGNISYTGRKIGVE